MPRLKRPSSACSGCETRRVSARISDKAIAVSFGDSHAHDFQRDVRRRRGRGFIRGHRFTRSWRRGRDGKSTLAAGGVRHCRRHDRFLRLRRDPGSPQRIALSVSAALRPDPIVKQPSPLSGRILPGLASGFPAGGFRSSLSMAPSRGSGAPLGAYSVWCALGEEHMTSSGEAGLALRRSTAAFDEPWGPACLDPGVSGGLPPGSGQGARNEPWAP